LKQKSVSARSLTAQRVLTLPFKVSFCDVVIYEMRVPAWFARQQLNPVGYVQPKCTKTIISDILICTGKFQILGFHLNLSKGNFLNDGISPQWERQYSHSSSLTKLKRREEKPSCHQRFESSFPSLNCFRSLVFGCAIHFHSSFHCFLLWAYLCPAGFLGLMDLAIRPLCCIDNGPVTLANSFHLTSTNF